MLLAAVHAAYCQESAFKPSPPSGLPPWASGLRVVAGRPSVFLGERQITAVYSETFAYGMHKRNLQMSQAGVECFVLIARPGLSKDYHTTYFWRDDGVYGDESDRTDDISLERQAAVILAERPDAVFMVRWGAEVPATWAAKYPDELQASEDKRRREASYASALAAEGRAEMARHLVRYCETRPWGKRIIGYLPFGQDEGTPTLHIEDCLFDQSPAMTRELRAYLAETYGNDAKLQAAWGDPTVTLATARQPSDSQWLAARASWQHWPAPKALRPYQDYFLTVRRCKLRQRQIELSAVRQAAGRPVLTATDAFKQPMFGWLIQDAFFAKQRGMDYRNLLLASGSIGVAEMMDHPALDALITPADYSARSVGFGWDSEGLNDSLQLRGKTILIEDDARGWVTNERETQGAWRTPPEARAGLLRNLTIAASRGLFPYWMNVGGGYFDDPELLRIVAEQIPVRQRLLSAPHAETEHAICLLLDDWSPLEEDFTSGFQQLAIVRQRNDELALTGLPWRIHLFDDLARDDFPVYRCYLLPNLFKLTPERLALIRAKLCRQGSVIIGGPGTAISDGQELSAKGASELFGFPMELIKEQSARRVLAYGGGHPALAGIAGSLVYGDSYLYGPVLQPVRDLGPSGAVELGKFSGWWFSNRAGLVLKEHGRGAMNNGQPGPRGDGDYAMVFSMATPVPAQVLRSLALYGGCVPWSSAGDVVAASRTMLAVHSMRAGERELHLPHRATVTDAQSGEVIGRGIARFTITLNAPDTRVFLLSD